MRKFILKLDKKGAFIRLHVYKSEGIRIDGDVLIKHPKEITNHNTYDLINKLLIEIAKVHKLEFKKLNANNVRLWVKNNVKKVYFRHSKNKLPDVLENSFKKLLPNAMFIND